MMALFVVVFLSLCFNFVCAVPNSDRAGVSSGGVGEMDMDKLFLHREAARDMFYHGYDNYMAKAYPWDELMPLSCKGRRWDERVRGTLDDSLGGFSTTLVDSLDMLALLGDYAEFRKAVTLVMRDVHFDRNVNVSVFETNIRVLGGLLSAHMLMTDPNIGPLLLETRASEQELQSGTVPLPYHGELLDMALDLGTRLLPAFRTKTGLPSHMVNLKYGVPRDDSPQSKETCVAAAGTFILEFGLLSRLSGVSAFETAARNALAGLWSRRSKLNLLGSTLNVDTGVWQTSHASIGAGVDSFYEYLMKAYILFGDEEFLKMFDTLYEAVDKHLVMESGFYQEVSMTTGKKRQSIISSLAAFWPSLQVLRGDVSKAKRCHEAFYSIWKKFDALPDLYNLDSKNLLQYGKDWPLRPELIESTYHLFKVTRDVKYLKMAEDILQTLQNTSRVPCGYASIANVKTHRLDDRMDSYFLSETTKYLFLIFDEALQPMKSSSHLFGHSARSPVAKDQEPLPINFSHVSFSTEGHLFLLWDSLRPQTKGRNKGETLPGLSINTDHVAMEENTGNQASNSREAHGLASAQKKGSNPFTIAPANYVENDAGMNLLAAAIGEHVAVGGDLNSEGKSLLKLQCSYTGTCTVASLKAKQSTAFEVGDLGIFLEEHESNERKQLARFEGSTAQFGVLLNQTHVSGKVVMANPADACTPPKVPDYGAAVVVVERGECSFVEKALVVQDAGGVAMVVMDKGSSSYTDANGENIAVEGLEENQYFQMADDGNGKDVLIPSLLITQKNGQSLLHNLKHFEQAANSHIVLDLWNSDYETADDEAMHEKLYIDKHSPFPLKSFALLGILPKDLINTVKQAFSPSAGIGLSETRGKVAEKP